MGQDRPGFFDRIGFGQKTRRMSRLLETPERASLDDLRTMSDELRAMRQQIDTLSARARDALSDRARREDGIHRPDQCEWAMRPEPWRVEVSPRGVVDVPSPHRLPGGVSLFHDSPRSEIVLRQEPVPPGVEGARFGLVLDIYRFDGSFISLVQDLPTEAVKGLSLNDVITVDMVIEREQPIEIYARLNVKHGPNTEQMVRHFDMKGLKGTADFDLAYSQINEKRVENAWLDLILEGPRMARIALWDMTLTRAPRADI